MSTTSDIIKNNNLNIEKWNAKNFEDYLKELHLKRYKIKYVSSGVVIERKLIKNMYTEYGKPATKKFIDICFNEHKNYNNDFIGLNFMFMNKYLKNRFLPLALKEIQLQEHINNDLNGIISKL